MSNELCGEMMGSEMLFKRILENSNIAVLLFDGALRLLYLNPAAEMLLALSARRAQGMAAEGLFAQAETFVAGLRGALSDNHPFTERELVLHLPFEHAVTVDCTVTPLADPEQGEALLVELAQVDRQLRIAREELLLTQQDVTRDVIRGFAHEIKNPLGGLRGAAQLLEHELESAELREYTAIIVGEADRLTNLVNRMLGPISAPQKQRISVHELLERVRQLVRREAPEGIALLRDYDPSLPDLYVDPDQLIQALLNLVRNAVQALDSEGQITLRTRIQRQVNIGPQRHKLVASIEVVDDGPGVPEEMIDKIFFPMVTGRSGGTGLGLPIAQELINRHQGLIEFHRRDGETVFTILIPLESFHE